VQVPEGAHVANVLKLVTIDLHQVLDEGLDVLLPVEGGRQQGARAEKAGRN
jgi:hypothetical protein